MGKIRGKREYREAGNKKRDVDIKYEGGGKEERGRTRENAGRKDG
jgi:hypothetical protein